MKISLSTARRLAVASQGLGEPWALAPTKEGALEVIERLGYVQIDTIAVVQRAHHHTFWCRQPTYTPDMLHELQAHDRTVFEGWTHAASYIPMRDYRYYMSRMQAFAERTQTREWLESHADIVAHVMGRIQSDGPLGSADFKSPPGEKRGPWWDWKPAKRVLEMMFSAGKLMVGERRNFQRLYDLSERVLPDWVDTSTPTSEEHAGFVIRHMLNAWGFAGPRDLHWRRRQVPEQLEVLQAMIETGEVTPVEIEGLESREHYALTERLKSDAQEESRAVHILSPFDNLTIRRDRLRQLFGFQYRLECYLPAAKRQHGYFSLPILWGDRFVGRLDSKADRKPRVFIVRKLTFEPGFEEYDELLPLLVQKLRAFAEFNGCDRFSVEDVIPQQMKEPLRQELG